MLEWLLGAGLAAVGRFMLAYLEKLRAEAHLRELGATTERAGANREAADAERRMAEANARPRDDDATLERLRRGDL